MSDDPRQRRRDAAQPKHHSEPAPAGSFTNYKPHPTLGPGWFVDPHGHLKYIPPGHER